LETKRNPRVASAVVDLKFEGKKVFQGNNCTTLRCMRRRREGYPQRIVWGALHLNGELNRSSVEKDARRTEKKHVPEISNFSIEGLFPHRESVSTAPL